MAQPGTDQHKGRVTIQEATHHTGAAADFPVQPLNHIVGTDAGPVLAGKIAVSKCHLNAGLHFPDGFFQLHRPQFLHHGFGLFPGSFLALLSVDCLEHLSHQLHLGARRYREHIALKIDGALASENSSPTSSSIQKHLSPTISSPPSKPQPCSNWKMLTQLSLSSFMPSAAPKTSRHLSSFILQSQPEWPYFQTLHPSFGAEKSHPHRHTDNTHPARADCANPQCGHMPSCSVRCGRGGHFTASHQLFDLTLDHFLVKLCNLVRHGLLSPFEWCVATSFYQRYANHVSFIYFSICEIYCTLSIFFVIKHSM